MRLTLNIGAIIGLAALSQSASAIFISQNLGDPNAPHPINELTSGLGPSPTTGNYKIMNDSVGYLAIQKTVANGGIGSFMCSSSAIGKRLLLAAAHCFDGTGDSDGAVDLPRANSVTFYRNGNPRTFTGTAFSNPGYNDWRTQAHDNDIAVVVLDQDLPVDLPLFSLFSGTGVGNVPMVITGYGNFGYNGQVLEPAGSYHRYSGTAFFDRFNPTYHTIEGTYSAPGTLHPGEPFAGYYAFAGASASGDSGGPAYSDFSGIQTAITSYGIDWNRNGSPDYGDGFGYTLVSYYRDWLRGFESDLNGYINWSDALIPSKTYCPTGVGFYCKGTGAGEAGDPVVVGAYAPPDLIGNPEMPIAPPPGSDVPEPSALALLGLGLLGIAVRNR